MTESTPPRHDRLVETPNGALFAREIPGDDPPIVLTDGFPDDHTIYDRLLPWLSPKRAVAFDWHGYGRSERSKLGGFSMPQFFGSVDKPDALAAIRAWTARLFDSLREQDKLVDSGALGGLEVPVSIIFGESDRYLSPSLAGEIAGLFTDPSLHLVPDASHWPQHHHPRVVADLVANIMSTQGSGARE